MSEHINTKEEEIWEKTYALFKNDHYLGVFKNKRHKHFASKRIQRKLEKRE